VPGKHLTISQCCFKINSTDWKDHQIATSNKAFKNLSSAIIPLLWNMIQDKLIDGDSTVSISDCVDENPSELESSDSDNKIGDNKNKLAHHTVNKVTGKQVPCR
jgi:hypothetical protein